MRSQHTIFRTMLILALSLLPAITSAPYASYAATLWYVAPNGNDSNSCSSPSAPCATINGAMAKAASGDTINVAGGTYYGNGNEVVLLNKSLTLVASSASGAVSSSRIRS